MGWPPQNMASRRKAPNCFTDVGQNFGFPVSSQSIVAQRGSPPFSPMRKSSHFTLINAIIYLWGYPAQWSDCYFTGLCAQGEFLDFAYRRSRHHCNETAQKIIAGPAKAGIGLRDLLVCFVGPLHFRIKFNKERKFLEPAIRFMRGKNCGLSPHRKCKILAVCARCAGFVAAA